MERKTTANGPGPAIELTATDEPVVERSNSKSHDDDSTALARLGKVSVLQRYFGFMAILGFSMLVISTWQGTFPLLGVGLENGGPAGVIYQFIIVWFGNMATFTSLAELASMAPTAGGQYYWVSILAPRSSHQLMSYITGWLTVVGWQACVASSSYVTGLFLQGFIEIVHPTYEPQLWHATLLMYGAIILCLFATTVSGKYLPMMESGLLVIYILGFFAILVPIVYLGEHGSAEEVFTLFNNGGGWSTTGISFLVGISANAFAFLGADSVYHMSEEVQNAATVVPKAMIWGLFASGVVGLAMYIAISFSAGDILAATDPYYSYPFIPILIQILNSRAGTAVVVAVLIIVDLGLLISVIAAASRMLWSFARDRGVPGWEHMVKVTGRSANPLNAIMITILVSFLLGLITIGSPTAFNGAISLTVVSLYASYFVACALLLYRRITGSITSYEEFRRSEIHGLKATNYPGSGGRLTWGPWRVAEPFGTIINILACVYLIVVFVFSFFPPATPVTPDTMNYACLVLGAVMLMSVVYYMLVAHRTYKGPVVDETVQHLFTE